MVLSLELGGDPEILALEALLEDCCQGLADVCLVAIHGRRVNVLHTEQQSDVCMADEEIRHGGKGPGVLSFDLVMCKESLINPKCAWFAQCIEHCTLVALLNMQEHAEHE